jgi:hypothetical protein
MAQPSAAGKKQSDHPMSAGWETNEAEWDALFKAIVKVHGEMQHKTS